MVKVYSFPTECDAWVIWLRSYVISALLTVVSYYNTVYKGSVTCSHLTRDPVGAYFTTNGTWEHICIIQLNI